MDEDYDDVESEGEENNEQTISECLEKFSTDDYIMEPGIFLQLQRYFTAGGGPEKVIDLLSSNYKGIALFVNELADWLIVAGLKIEDVQALVENHLKEMIVKTFDPKKADTIFTAEGKTPSWLPEMIKHATWRSLIYKLAEEYPDCLMLNFTIKLISDAGFQAEITSISTAAQQMEVFSSVLKNTLYNFLRAPYDEQSSVIEECTKLVCHGLHTYVYSQVVLKVLSRRSTEMRRLQQEISREAQKTNDITPVTVSLNGSVMFPQACQALMSMLSRSTLNPADITVLYKLYMAPDPPPVSLLRVPEFLELLVDSLFKPGVKLNPEHKPKYIYLLAYACSVSEAPSNKKTGSKKVVPNKEELRLTTQAIDKVHTICYNNKGSTELILEVNTLFQYIKFPVVAVGIVKWVEYTVMEVSYFKLCIEHTPTHLALLDEVNALHPVLHPTVFKIYVTLFESKQDDLDVLVQLEIKKMFIDRMVSLLCNGYALPVVKYMNQCWSRGDTDISLIRYFVTEVLEAIAPPYAPEFVNLFLPIVENDDITGTMRCCEGDTDPVSEFIVHCKGMVMI